MGTNLQSDIMLQRIYEREQELQLLFSFAQRLAPISNQDSFQKFILEDLKNQIHFDSFSIGFSSKMEKHYKLFFHSSNDYESLKSNNYELNDGFFNVALETAEPIIITSESIKKNTAPNFIKDTFQKGIRQIVSYSIQIQNNFSAVVFIGFKKNDTLTRSNSRLLRGLSTPMGITIDTILLREKIEFRNTHNSQEIIPKPKSQTTSLDAIIGKSKKIETVKKQILAVSESDLGVLILGESGTGKELVANAIHENSAFSINQMVRINCGAIPKDLLESELFGHEKGSFTGAIHQKIGKFERAHNSTIFLDEIGELPLELQVKLLRALQEKEIERIGGNETISVNVRIIAATNRNLQHEVELGNFRADLFYRLNIFPIEIPALREHTEDIEELACIFLKKFARNNKIKKLSRNVIQSMKRYSWPGNIRELEHTIERAILLSEGQTIKEISLETIIETKNAENNAFFTQIIPLATFEKDYILWVLSKCNGRISGPNGAAILLGMPSTTLQSKMDKLGIKKIIT